jgi:hypothetical protein
MLSQVGEDNFIHHVGFRSCNCFLTKINYEIYIKELLAIVDAFEKLRHLLERAQHEITMYSDHKNL